MPDYISLGADSVNAFFEPNGSKKPNGHCPVCRTWGAFTMKTKGSRLLVDIDCVNKHHVQVPIPQ